jgi:hypothetical protein
MGDTQREIEKSWMKDIRRSKKKIPGNPGLQIQRDPCRRSMKVTGKSRRNTE